MFDDDPDMPPLVNPGYGGGYGGYPRAQSFMPEPGGGTYGPYGGGFPGGAGRPFAAPRYPSSESESEDPYGDPYGDPYEDTAALTPPTNYVPLNNNGQYPPAQYPPTWPGSMPYASAPPGMWPSTGYEGTNAQAYPPFGVTYPDTSQPNVPLYRASTNGYPNAYNRLSAPSYSTPYLPTAASASPWAVQTQASAFSALSLSPNLNSPSSYKSLHSGRHWKMERPSEWRKDFKVKPGMGSLVRSLSFGGSGCACSITPPLVAQFN